MSDRQLTRFAIILDMAIAAPNTPILQVFG